MKDNLDKNLVEAVNRNFGLKLRRKLFPEAEFLEILTLAIANLLQHDLQKLLSLLYRLDVNETHFRQALLADDSRQIAHNIAKLVLAREKLRIEIRQRYQND
ncbi:MAG TPA: hypothetical protein VK927_04110 [Adhaeribacter sp.]|nr:hypothetical protein [Adhaeribacter sp.]